MSHKKSFFSDLLSNHVLGNLLFGLVIVLGVVSYSELPRQKDPSINFNWIQVTTVLPGASAIDVEKKITNPLEEGLETIKDIKFVSSNSREGNSSILIRFNDINDEIFDERIADVRRIIQKKTEELPEDATEPDIFEITSSNAFPSVTLVLNSDTDGEELHYQARRIEREINRFKRVDRVQMNGLFMPEIHIKYDPQKLTNYGLTVRQLQATILSALKDVAPGDINTDKQTWLIRVLSVDKTPEAIANIPINTANAEIPLSDIATVERKRSESNSMVRFNNKPAVLFSVMKKDGENTLKLVDELNVLSKEENLILNRLGMSLTVTDDQTEVTESAISIMETNFLIGLILVFIVTLFFLGGKISLMTTIGIPFTITGTFLVLKFTGFTLNTSVLLGIVIALGMLVDDAIVVVESIYFKLSRGVNKLTAIIEGVKDVVAPVTTSVLTTSAAFLPLILMPGILGKFMMIVPLVVTIALFISLIEAYWLLPSHLMLVSPNFKKVSKLQYFRNKILDKMQFYYAKIIIKLLRHPLIAILTLSVIFFGSIIAPAKGLIKYDFFAADTIRLFYVSIEMPVGTPLYKTMAKAQEVESNIRKVIPQNEYRSIVSYAGSMFTQTEPLLGKRYGQIQISLKSKKSIKQEGLTPLEVEEIVEIIRPTVESTQDVEKVFFLTLTGGPPVSKPISMKLLGDVYEDILAATREMQSYMRTIPTIRDINDDYLPGGDGLDLRLNYANLREFKIAPEEVIQIVTSLVDGIFITTVNIDNEQVDVRLMAQQYSKDNNEFILNKLLNTQISSASGEIISLNELVLAEINLTNEKLRHYNFKRAITIEADIDKDKTDTVQANQLLIDHWNKIKSKYSGISVDFSGELDDIQESIDSMLGLFILGLGLIYLILGTQFRSYIQPFIVLSAVPMAFIGVIAGILITGYALSLFTLYGIVALSGIAVNASIVMISTANKYTNRGLSKGRAIFYAARRRLVPITITTFTTVAGLSSLALGLGGKSLLWGPVASAIVFGLMISSTLTVLFLPSLYVLNFRSIFGSTIRFPIKLFKLIVRNKSQ